MKTHEEMKMKLPHIFNVATRRDIIPQVIWLFLLFFLHLLTLTEFWASKLEVASVAWITNGYC